MFIKSSYTRKQLIVFTTSNRQACLLLNTKIYVRVFTRYGRGELGSLYKHEVYKS